MMTYFICSFFLRMLKFIFTQQATKNIVNLKEITKPIHKDLNCVDKVIKSPAEKLVT